MAVWETWVRSTWLHAFVINQGWLWPTFEILHYIGLSLLLGTVGLFDLRVLGVARRIEPAALHRLIPWGVAGFLINLVTGLAFFAGFPEQYAYNAAFRWKIALMLVAGANILLFYTTVFRRLQTLPAGSDAPAAAKLMTALSLACWLGVIVCGRYLTFFRPPFAH